MSDAAKSSLLAPKRLALLEAVRKQGPSRRHAPSIVAVPRDREMPLSFAEQRLWFLHQLEPDNPVYNIAGDMWFLGQVDVDALSRTYNEMARRHETFRTTFVEVDGAPRKVIAPSRNVDMPLIDLSHLGEAEARAEAERIATEEVRRPFDFVHGPLIRMTLVRVKSDTHLMIATKHHIVSDGWSVGGFLYEMARIYEAFSSGKPSPLPDLEVQHSDYAYWQRNWLQGEVLEAHVRFWREQLDGAPELLDLPSDRPRPAVQTYRGDWKIFSLPMELTRAIRAFSRQEEVTLFMTLLAAFEVLLRRYSGQEDIVVGSPMSNRNRMETEPILGVIFNTLVLRVSLAGDPTFRELVRRVREVALNAYAHQDLPFEQLVEALQPQRSLSHAPIFQVMFVLQNSPMPEFTLPNVTLKKLDFHPGTSKYDLTWTIDEKDPFVLEKEQPLGGSVEYSTDMYDRTTIERMIDQYRTVLEAAMANPDVRLSQIPVMPAAERRLLEREWNATECKYEDDRRLTDLFRAQLERTPDAVALRYQRQAITFRELHARANALANYLQQHGVGPETVVAICLERTPDLLVSILAVLQAGGAYVPLDPAYPSDRVTFMLEDAHAVLVLTQSSLVDRLPERGVACVCLDRDWDAIAQVPSTPPESAAAPESVAYLIYTSGSTGRPKGVAITHRNAVNMLAWARDAFAPEDRAGVLAATSVCFDLSIFELFLPLAHGGTVVLARNVLDLTELPAALDVTLINTVPSAATEVLRQGPLPANVRCVNLAGERLPAELVQQIGTQHPGVRVANLYGPSETTTYSTAAMLDPDSAAAPPIGRPIANTQIHVLDEQGAPTPIGVPGEVFIGGAGVARGYLDRPDLTAERFIPDPFTDRSGARLYRTGDLARWRAGGDLEYLGRNDHQVKVRGFRIELGEIEHVLDQHPSVAEAVVVARTEGSNDVRLVAYVSLEAGADAVDLRAFLKARLPEYMVPNLIVPLDRLPRTPNGKIDRGALPDAIRPPDLTRVITPPRTDTERMLAAIWQELLKIHDVSVDDDFFALGGHSLLAMRMTARLRRDAAVDLPLRAVFEAPTLGELAQALERLQASTPATRRPDILPAVRSATAPLSSSQRRLWFLDQLDRKSRAYTIAAAFHLAGPLDADALNLALQAVVHRHEALRTTFSFAGEEPIQEIHPTMTVHLPTIDLQGVSEDELEAEVLRYAQAEARKPFPLDRGPLIRATLLRLRRDRHVLLLTMHHIVSDGWSIGIFLNELLRLYDAFSTDKPAALAPLSIQYADFAIWERTWLQSEAVQAQLAYWQRQLAAAPPLLTLPTDRPRPAVETHQGARHSFALADALGDALIRIGRPHQATLFMTLLAAWQALLSGYSGQTDISIGSPIAGRTNAETEGLIGCFVNMLVLRSDLSGDPSFTELLRRVRQTTLDAYANQDVPFEQLMEAFHPERSLSYSPLFQSMFVLQNTPLPNLAQSNLRVAPLDLPTETSKFDLSLAIMETPAGLRGAIEFKTGLFERSTIEQMAGHFEAFLESAVSNPDLPLSQLLPASLPTTPADPRVASAPLSAREAFLAEIEAVRARAGVSRQPLAYEAPRTETERILAQIYKELLKIDEVGIHDDFFARGGHSLLAVQLLARIRETFHIDLVQIELYSVFESPSIAVLSGLVDRAAANSSASAGGLQPVSRSSLVALHTGEIDMPCFCVHPGGGHVFCYMTLANRLGALGLSVYGLEARGLDGTQRPHVRIESMASSYIDAIQTVQAKGPYVFIGWSLGGLVALEMAQQLTMQGENVALLAVVDSYLVESAPPEGADEAMCLSIFMQDLATLHGRPMPALPDLPANLTRDERFAAMMHYAESTRLVPPDINLSQLHDHYNVFRANIGAMIAYRAQPYAGRIQYFQAQQTKDERIAVWERVARGGLEKRTIPGDHYSILRSPHVDVLVKHLQASLQLT
jgi:amino acid adenylation domain-containing protein